MAVLAFLVSVIVGGITSEELMQIAILALGALGVYATPNSGPKIIPATGRSKTPSTPGSPSATRSAPTMDSGPGGGASCRCGQMKETTVSTCLAIDGLTFPDTRTNTRRSLGR
ncbi:hypothetical protein GCM10010201_35210 [Pilimelia columellifera subsp. columellifera]|uniref:Uncharacterized protein n=1 Tax=Pilimelia columellifera subsp. columellifera TaxID=706583 RepID=A0ABN3NRL9_9ACTN